jgi:formate-dependent phosphoribosylglycinamide formyltransferase (GAR transformylase)
MFSSTHAYGGSNHVAKPEYFPAMASLIKEVSGVGVSVINSRQSVKKIYAEAAVLQTISVQRGGS